MKLVWLLSTASRHVVIVYTRNYTPQALATFLCGVSSKSAIINGTKYWIVAVCTAKMASAIAFEFCGCCPWGLFQPTDRQKFKTIDVAFRLIFLNPVICMNTGWGCLIPTAFRDFLLIDVYKSSTATTEAIGHDKDYKYLSRKTLSLFVIVDFMLSCSLWNVRSHHFF